MSGRLYLDWRRVFTAGSALWWVPGWNALECTSEITVCCLLHVTAEEALYMSIMKNLSWHHHYISLDNPQNRVWAKINTQISFNEVYVVCTHSQRRICCFVFMNLFISLFKLGMPLNKSDHSQFMLCLLCCLFNFSHCFHFWNLWVIFVS